MTIKHVVAEGAVLELIQDLEELHKKMEKLDAIWRDLDKTKRSKVIGNYWALQNRANELELAAKAAKENGVNLSPDLQEELEQTKRNMAIGKQYFDNVNAAINNEKKLTCREIAKFLYERHQNYGDALTEALKARPIINKNLTLWFSSDSTYSDPMTILEGKTPPPKPQQSTSQDAPEESSYYSL